MLKIRLARVGKKKRPSYRFIVSDSQKDLYGKALEIVGHYNPFSKVIEVKKDRILEWIGKGAQPSPTVHNLLVDQNVITGPKVVASKPGKKKAEETASAQPKAEAAPESAPTETQPAAAAEAEKPAQEAAPAEPKAEDKPAEKPAEEKEPAA